jgi:hypothetical protein
MRSPCRAFMAASTQPQSTDTGLAGGDQSIGGKKESSDAINRPAISLLIGETSPWPGHGWTAGQGEACTYERSSFA